MNTSIAISSKDSLANNQIKVISGVNPNADNAHMATFGKMVNNLTSNILNSLTRIDRTDITNADSSTATF